jgi:hypothetical protein
MSSFIKGILDDMTGDDIYGDPTKYKKVDMSKKEDQIAAAVLTDVQNILKGNQKVIDNVVTRTWTFLDFNAEKRNYFRALCVIISSFVIDLPSKLIICLMLFRKW